MTTSVNTSFRPPCDKYKVFAYIFQEYWEDIGTVRAFFEANLALTETVPPYNFFDHLNPIYTHARFLPASKINGAQVNKAVIAEGCIITAREYRPGGYRHSERH